MTPEQIDDRVLAHIRTVTLRGIGVRTTEMRSLEEELDLGEGTPRWGELACDAIGRLADAGRIAFCTEKFRQTNNGTWTGDYCWIVPAEHDINQRYNGFTPIEKVPVSADRVWDLPMRPACWEG